MLKAMVYQNAPYTPEDFEPNAENNFIEREVSFQPSEAIKLRLVPVHLHSSPNQQAAEVTYTYQDQQSDALKVLLNIYRISPISNLVWDVGLEFELELFILQIIIPAMVSPSSHGNGVEWDLSKSDDRDEVNACIALLKALFSADYEGWNWYGMVEPTVSMGNFSGWANSGVAHGQMNPATSGPPWYVRGGNTLAHEVGHNRGWHTTSAKATRSPAVLSTRTTLTRSPTAASRPSTRTATTASTSTDRSGGTSLTGRR